MFLGQCIPAANVVEVLLLLLLPDTREIAVTVPWGVPLTSADEGPEIILSRRICGGGLRVTRGAGGWGVVVQSAVATGRLSLFLCVDLSSTIKVKVQRPSIAIPLSHGKLAG